MKTSGHRLALAGLAVAIVALAIGSMRLDTATDDEPAHLAAGMVKLVHGRLDYFRAQPPLMNTISAIPLVMAGYELAPGWSPYKRDHWAVGTHFLYRSGYDAQRILFLARLPTVAMLLALCFAVYWFVRRESGSVWGGVAAFALTGFCPNLMAHGRLATVDLAVTFFSFAAAALMIVTIETGSYRVAPLAGIAAAAAILSKSSGNLLGPYFIALLLVAFLMRRVPDAKRLWIGFAIAIATALAFASALILIEGSASYISERFPDVPRLLVPLAEYRATIQAIRGWYAGSQGMPQFLLGEFSPDGWGHYFLVALFLKTPIPAILLVIAGIVAGARRIRFPVVALLLFAAMFLAAASLGRLDLGVRHVLPIYPFVYAAVMISLVNALTQHALTQKALTQKAARRSSIRAIAPVVILIGWHIAENVRAYPSYIAYFNQAVGSHRNADRFLIDSNLDWGQDLRRLEQWTRREGVQSIAVHYFGGGNVSYEFGNDPRRVRAYTPDQGRLPKGWLAVSRHFYRLSFAPNVWRVDYDTLLEQARARYVTSIGGSIDVYFIE